MKLLMALPKARLKATFCSMGLSSFRLTFVCGVRPLSGAREAERHDGLAAMQRAHAEAVSSVREQQ